MLLYTHMHLLHVQKYKWKVVQVQRNTNQIFNLLIYPLILSILFFLFTCSKSFYTILFVIGSSNTQRTGILTGHELGACIAAIYISVSAVSFHIEMKILRNTK